MSVEIEELPRAQIDRICDLFANVYGHPIDTRQWNWKYHEGPRLGSVNMAARTADGEWVGHVGASVFPGGGDGKGLAMAQICDIMVKREVRGGLESGGVYPRLVRAIQETLKARFNHVFAYGFPGVRPFRLGERLGFYRSLYRCESFQASHPLRPSPSSWLWSASLGEWDSERLDRIWNIHAKQDRPLQVNKPGAYLAWRYRDHPERTYRLWILKRLFRDAGWLVSGETPDGGVQVVDALLPSPESATDALAALGRALADRDRRTPVTVTSWLQHRGAIQQETPILAIEVKVGDWHTGCRPPYFQPADTDVY